MCKWFSEMTTTKGLIAFFISLTILLGGCGKSTPGYKFYRINDTLLVFLAMNNRSKIVKTTLENNELHVDIDNGKKIEKRITKLQTGLEFKLIEPYETARIKGTDRINGYGVVHLTVSPPRQGKLTTTFNWSGWRIKKLPKKAGPFKNIGTFRSGNRITAYCFLSSVLKPSWKTSKLGLRVEFEPHAIFKNVEYGAHGNRVINVSIDDLDILNENIRILLDDLQPHENVNVEDKKKLGDDIFVVNFNVVQNNSQPTRVAPNRNRSFNRRNLNLIDR